MLVAARMLTATLDAARSPARPDARQLDAARGVTAPDACDRCWRPRGRCTCPVVELPGDISPAKADLPAGSTSCAPLEGRPLHHGHTPDEPTPLEQLAATVEVHVISADGERRKVETTLHEHVSWDDDPAGYLRWFHDMAARRDGRGRGMPSGTLSALRLAADEIERLRRFGPAVTAALRLVYVAGPYTHPDPAENTHTAIRAGNQLLDSGRVVPVIPHLSHLWHLITPRPYQQWLDYDLHLLRRCDAVLRLPGESPGADAEVVEAARLELPVFSDATAVVEWAIAQ